MRRSGGRPCEWLDLRTALRRFACAAGTQSAEHIKPLHWYVACRLCLEGGFEPEHITPRPPFVIGPGGRVAHDPAVGAGGEQTILGGLKTKQVDVAVTLDHIGPVVAVSMKGTVNAIRNLTNRMEEAGGDCTNLHLTYPSLVYGFWHVVRANQPGPLPANAPVALRARRAGDSTPPGECRREDAALDAAGRPVGTLERYHNALVGLSGRDGLRDSVTRYEAVALSLVDVTDDATLGLLVPDYPAQASPLRLEHFFEALYAAYDLRFVYQAPDLSSRTRRRVWAPDSPAFAAWSADEYQPRVGCEDLNADL